MLETIIEKLEILEGKNYDLVSLYSGGLDSLLATKMILDMGHKVLGVKILMPFNGEVDDREPSFDKVKQLGKMDLLLWRTDHEFMEIVRNPRFGYGKNMNPCIDCKIYFMMVAREVMKKVGAKGIITGDVLGERPMSQNMANMQLIEKEAGVDGKVIRPLTAKNYKESDLEKEGFIDREKLLDFKGRGRSRQFKLAEKLGFKDYEQPAGGCLLTDPGYSHRLKESLGYDESGILDMHLLRFGRHFRLPGGSKLILGRNKDENSTLKGLFPPNWVKFDGIDIKGPWAGIQGSASLYDLKLAAQIWARYSQGKTIDPLEMRLIYPKNKKQILITHPLKEGQEEPYLIVQRKEA